MMKQNRIFEMVVTTMQRLEVNFMSRFANMEMAEVYGRLSEALDMTVVHRKQPSRISVHDGHSISINIEAQGESLSATGNTKLNNFESEANAKYMAETIKDKINSSGSKTGSDDI